MTKKNNNLIRFNIGTPLFSITYRRNCAVHPYTLYEIITFYMETPIMKGYTVY